MEGEAFIAAIAAFSGLAGAAAGGFATYVVARHRAEAAASAAAKEREWVAEVRGLVAEFLSLDVFIGLCRSRWEAPDAAAEALYEEFVAAIHRHNAAKHRLLSLLDAEDPAHRALIEAVRRVADASHSGGGEPSATLRLDLAQCARVILNEEDDGIEGRNG